jgi:hypothetical protein
MFANGGCNKTYPFARKVETFGNPQLTIYANIAILVQGECKMISRRDFIKLLGLAGAVVLTPLRVLGHLGQRDYLQERELTGELYGGFLLLEEGTEIPEFVQHPKIPLPNGCGVGVNQKNAKPSAISQFFETPGDLANRTLFRIYMPRKMPDGLRYGKAYTLSNNNDSPYEAFLAYESYNSEAQLWETTVAFSIQLHYPKPLPLWLIDPVEDDIPGISYDKVDFLPNPGLRMITRRGFTYYWIESDIFYTLSFEPLPNEAVAIDFINRLVPSR